MPYIKTNWASATITPDNFNKMQTQYQAAVEDAIGVRIDNSELRCEIVSDFPAHRMGRIIFHTGLKSFFFSTGSSWHMEPIKTDFGNAQLGDFTSTGNVTYTNTVGGTVVRNYKNFTLDTGHSLTIDNPGRLLLIRSWGNIVINGTIDMNYKGGYGDRYIDLFGTTYDLMGGDGGNGGNGSGNTGSGGLGGTSDANESCAGGRRGGGGGGAGTGYPGGVADGGNGGAKNTAGSSAPFGGGSINAFVTSNGTNNRTGRDCTNGGGGSGGATAIGSAFANAGLSAFSTGGGVYANQGAGGGGGSCFALNRDASFSAITAGTSGQLGGGCVILLAMGTVTINGQVLANGGAGGNGGEGNYIWSAGERFDGFQGGGAGGSGGGRILVIHQQGYNNAGLVTATGGAGGSGNVQSWSNTPGQNGSPGSNGNIDVVQLT